MRNYIHKYITMAFPHEQFNIKVLYEDPHIVAVYKPAGLVVHSDGKTQEPTLTDWVVEKYPEAHIVGEPIELTEGGSIERPGIVHRLDRGTSGVLLIARTTEGHALLKEQFQNRTIRKKYYAFVYGALKDTYGIINRPIGRSPSDFRRWSATRGARGELRPAETWYFTYAARAGYSAVEVEPKTGRTHQIRVHFKAVNHPVVCDTLYAPEKPAALGFTRTALHAAAIQFMNVEGKKITVQAPFPEDFLNAFTEMGVEPPKSCIF